MTLWTIAFGVAMGILIAEMLKALGDFALKIATLLWQEITYSHEQKMNVLHKLPKNWHKMSEEEKKIWTEFGD